jgi:hypothetical protein
MLDNLATSRPLCASRGRLAGILNGPNRDITTKHPTGWVDGRAPVRLTMPTTKADATGGVGAPFAPTHKMRRQGRCCKAWSRAREGDY